MAKFLAQLPAESATGFRVNQRCMLYFAVDGTFLWILSHWLRPGRLSGPALLLNLCVGVVTSNHYSRLGAIMTSNGLAVRQDSVDAFTGRFFRWVSDNETRKGGAAGLRGSTRAVLNLFSFNHMEAVPRYAQYALENCERAWDNLFEVSLDEMTQMERSAHTIAVLERDMRLNAELVSALVAKQLEFVEPRLFQASTWPGLGERSRMNLRSLIRCGEDAGPLTLQAALTTLSVECSELLPGRFRRVLGGVDGDRCMQAPMPLGIEKWSNVSLHQHMNCEEYKIEHPEKGTLHSNPSPEGQWLSWLNRSVPCFQRAHALRVCEESVVVAG